MKKKIILSMLVIMVAIAATVGGTLAWFTDEAVITPNVFTAGNVSLDAEDSWQGQEGMVVGKWNPGDCSPKYIAVKYTGNKNAFLRMKLEMGWEGGLDNSNIKLKKFVFEGDDGVYEEYKKFYNQDNGTWMNLPSGVSLKDWFADINYWVDYDITEDWELSGDWYYYKSGTGPYSFTLTPPSVEIKSLDPEVDATVIPLFYAVCLDGLSTGNSYQGKQFTISATFQAIQGSHSDEWEWDEVNFNTGLVEND